MAKARIPPQSVSSALGAIGMTPVVQLGEVVPPHAADVFVKLEYFNTTGSYKDRMALAMVEEAEARGDLKPGMTESNELSKEYHRLGLKKKRRLLSLKNKGDLKAVLVVNLSNLGLNLSGITNSISTIIVDPEDLTGDILKRALDLALKMIRKMEIPVMLYPDACAGDLGIKNEKVYNLWILNMRYSDPYFRYINRFMRLM